MDIERIIAAANGDQPADLVLANARIINVYTGRIDRGDIALAGGHVAGIGDYRAEKVIDLDGRYVAPGFIDPHLHIESAMVSVTEFARSVVPRGTTTVVADPHEIANVLGTAGIDYMLRSAANQPMNVYYTLSSCVPATDMETGGARLTAADLAPYMKNERVLALAEMMNFPGVINREDDVMAKIALARAHGKPVDGHAPGLSGHALNAYIAAGISSDHESTAAAEAREKLAAGMFIMIRQGTGARNLEALLPIVDPLTAHRLMWCTDDRHPHDLIEEGHIDSLVRRAIELGVDPVRAIQMATLNPARYFGLGSLGAVAPGKLADLAVFSHLDSPRIEQVYHRGIQVAEKGRMVSAIARPEPATAPPSMKVNLDTVDFSIPLEGKRVRVIEIVPDQIVTRQRIEPARVSSGAAVADPGRDILKIAVIERHGAGGNMGKGFVSGFGLKKGALASSVAHDSHNIIAVGADDRDMRAATAAVVRMGGGLAVSQDGLVRCELPLPIAGLMSDQPIRTVNARLEILLQAAGRLGAIPANPFMTLSFLALPVIPQLKITDKGLCDVNRFQIVDLFVD